MHIDLSGKNVLITGASRGIGREIARHFARAGATVGIHYHRDSQEASALAAAIGARGHVFQADLSQADEARKLFAAALSQWGRLHVLVNNAGIALPALLTDPWENWLAGWDETLAVNLRSTAILSRAAIMHFIEANSGGHIINIASRAAFRGDTAEYLAYAASKGGIVSLTRSLARAYGRNDIKAFVIAPGFTRTEMTEAFIERYGEELVNKDLALTRLTEPGDIAPLVVFLASGLADHATGGTFDVNAGSYVH